MSTAVLNSRGERPRRPRRMRGKGWAFVLAIAVELGFLAVLVFSVQWQNRKPEPVTAELYAPPVKIEPPKLQPLPPLPEVKPPLPPPKPEPVIEKPDTRAAEIALKAKQEQERKIREEQERRAKEAKEAEDKRKLEERRAAEAKERQQKEMAAMRLQAEREAQMRAQAASELQQRQAAEASARSRSEADWIRRIQAKVKGNVIVPIDLAGNPEAIFEVVQLPTGEIIQATLRKSSGNRAYDAAVQRAIIKSSPLPRPDRPELFERVLTLKFRPQD